MKDRISMALKEPILQQGFEIICKNLAELEKENAELNKKLSKAGRPEWHKVADGDLPDNTDSVLSDKCVIVYYNFTHDCWVDERASVEIDDVIAWCEIPKYTEE